MFFFFVSLTNLQMKCVCALKFECVVPNLYACSCCALWFKLCKLRFTQISLLSDLCERATTKFIASTTVLCNRANLLSFTYEPVQSALSHSCEDSLWCILFCPARTRVVFVLIVLWMWRYMYIPGPCCVCACVFRVCTSHVWLVWLYIYMQVVH